MAKIENLKQLSILGVADSLGMELVRTGSHTYSWKKHDSFIINTRDNYFNWFSRSKGGDVITMVQIIREEETGQAISFKEAKHFLEEGNFDAIDLTEEIEREPFSYYLEPFETDFSEASQYLTKERQLSTETINFFMDKGVLAQATKKTGNTFEPVIVFKSLNSQNEIVGASLQGIKENHELHARGRLKQIMRASDGLTGMHVDIGTPRRLVFAEAPIDLMSYYELHRDTLKDVRLVAMDGLKESTISRHVADLMYEMGELNERVEVKNYPTFLAHTSQMTNVLKQDRFLDLITIAVDNDEAGRNFIERLESKKINLVSDLPTLSEGAEKMDWNDYLKGQKEKALDRSQEQQKKERTSQYKGSLQPEAEGSTSPVLEKSSTFERSVTSRPTTSSRYLNFTIDGGFKSRKTRLDHSIDQHDLKKLNRRGYDIQKSAQFYLDELANTKINYFTSEGNIVQVKFSENNFMHLTGLKIIGEGQTPAKTLHDFAQGGELSYADIRIGNNESVLDKIKVLPDLEMVLQTDSFYFDQLQDIPRYEGRFDSLIKADDKDLMLLFRTNDESTSVPVSIFKVRPKLLSELQDANKNVIIGIYRERENGVIEQIDINKTYVKDDGREMFEILKNQTVFLEKEKVKMEELKSSYENEPLQERIDNFKAQYAERYPKDITNSFINFIREGVEDDDIQIMHQIIDSYDSFPTANQFEKNLPDLFEEFKEIDKLFTSVNRADIPDNVYSEKEVLELLSKLESNSEEGYIWTDESYFKDNFRNPGFVSKVITQYFEEGDIDRLLNKKSVHLTVGDTTFKIDSVDPSYSIYSIEDLAERISEDLKVNSTNTILQKLEELNRDFLDAKDIINSKYHSLIQEYGEPITIAETKKEEYERDSDGDGIPDEIERNMGTNPYSADSDGDGKSDQEEVSFGSNPLKNEIDYSSNSTQISQEKSVSELIKSNDSKGLAKVLKDGVREYFKSDIYINYLIAMSKFHSYSPRNIQLILAQNPNASHVASFKKWKEDFERSVNKGSKALRIFAPVTIKEKDPKTGKILVDKNGKEKTKTYFKLVPVFDVSQTNGKELAKPVYDLEGTYQDYGNLYKAAKEVSEANGVPITFENDLDGAHGTYSRQTNSISILKGMSEQQTLKTLFHEMAHSELHTLDKLLENPLSRSTKELQAESVAFVVSNHYGLDTSEYSFGYLASWAEDKEGLTDLEGQIKIVQKEANNLITKIDSVLEKYQNKEVTKDAFQEKLSQFKSKSPEKGHEIKEEVKVKEPSKKEVKSDNEMSL